MKTIKNQMAELENRKHRKAHLTQQIEVKKAKYFLESVLQNRGPQGQIFQSCQSSTKFSRDSNEKGRDYKILILEEVNETEDRITEIVSKNPFCAFKRGYTFGTALRLKITSSHWNSVPNTTSLTKPNMLGFQYLINY
uniref:Uncharacterized protein n=1 Tax=Romanomermis culicivorax TaxID=13658 RepID=A0A915HW10_ROMCU